MRVEPSLQACFVDYGGNRHGFMAFGEIHPDYYNLSAEELAAVDKEVDEIIENKKQAIREREAERERIRREKAAAREAREAEKARQAAEEAAAEQNPESAPAAADAGESSAAAPENTEEHKAQAPQTNDVPAESLPSSETAAAETEEPKKHPQKKRLLKKRIRKQEEALKEAEKSGKKTIKEPAGSVDTVENAPEDSAQSPQEDSGNRETAAETESDRPLKVLAEDTGCTEPSISEEMDDKEEKSRGLVDEDMDVDDDDDAELDFELQRKLIRARKLFHRNKIQDVIKEGQIVLVQVVKEERGNKGAALTTYLSLAGRYCVLMPNRIKSGGVSRKITNAADRNRLKGIVRELPLTADMSIIVRTAGEEKPKAEIVRDYNYLIRTWNQIRLDSLKNKAPALIHEEGNLIKRALRDIYSKDTAEIIVAGEEAYKLAKDFFRILSPHNLKKIKNYRNNDMPLFQRFQVEGQLDKLHETNAQLESGGYLVINPTEALVSIDVNSGRATKEKDLEETALKTNLEACDEIARQLRMRNLAGLVVIDFIDMDEPANNHAVEKRMKEALKKDRSRIQVGKMSMFGLLELSRQRMHSSFWESNYQTCPHCQGKGIVRTTESSAVYVLRGIEEEGIKNRSSKINVFIPTDIAIYILNQKRQMLVGLEQKYKMEVVVSADDSIKCVSDYRIERTKLTKEEKNAAAAPQPSENPALLPETEAPAADRPENETAAESAPANEEENRFERRRGRGERRRGRNRFDRRRSRGERGETETSSQPVKERQEAVILYNSHEDIISKPETPKEEPAKEKSTWWKKLIKG